MNMIKKIIYYGTMPLRGLGLSKKPIFRFFSTSLDRYFKSNIPTEKEIDFPRAGRVVYILDPLDSLGLSLRPYEPEITEVLGDVLGKNKVFVDIGANIGYHTIYGAKLAKAVIAFEPQKDNFAILQENVARNSCPNVICENFGVSDREGAASIFLCGNNKGGHSLVKSDEVGKEEAIRTIILDSYLAGRKVDVIKMDIEGWELHALKGMLETLKRSRPVLISEFRASSIQTAGGNPEEFLSILSDLGYNRSEIGKPIGDALYSTHNYLFRP